MAQVRLARAQEALGAALAAAHPEQPDDRDGLQHDHPRDEQHLPQMFAPVGHRREVNLHLGRHPGAVEAEAPEFAGIGPQFGPATRHQRKLAIGTAGQRPHRQFADLASMHLPVKQRPTNDAVPKVEAPHAEERGRAHRAGGRDGLIVGAGDPGRIEIPRQQQHHVPPRVEAGQRRLGLGKRPEAEAQRAPPFALRRQGLVRRTRHPCLPQSRPCPPTLAIPCVMAPCPLAAT